MAIMYDLYRYVLNSPSPGITDVQGRVAEWVAMSPPDNRGAAASGDQPSGKAGARRSTDGGNTDDGHSSQTSDTEHGGDQQVPRAFLASHARIEGYSLGHKFCSSSGQAMHMAM
jgi:hypothetical protein